MIEKLEEARINVCREDTQVAMIMKKLNGVIEHLFKEEELKKKARDIAYRT